MNNDDDDDDDDDGKQRVSRYIYCKQRQITSE